MKKITYNEETIALLQSLKRREISRIYHDGHYQFVFDFSDEYVTAVPIDLDAATQNKSDEAIVVRFDLNAGEYNQKESDNCLFSETTIDRIWVARTLLYFTDFMPYESEEDAICDIPQTSPTESRMREILRSASGGYSEIVCHPNSVQLDPTFRNEYSNLVDAGILVKIGDCILSCFSRNNGFIVPTLVQTIEEFETDEVYSNYQLIEL